MDGDIQMEIVSETDPEASLRRFRWKLVTQPNLGIASPQTFATKREAAIDGQIALDRARQRVRQSA